MEMNEGKLDITDQDVENILNFLAGTDRPFAEAMKAMRLAERRLKTTVAVLKQQSDAKSNAAKEDDALASEAYATATITEAEALGDLELLKAQRASALSRLDTWRSLGANRRKS